LALVGGSIGESAVASKVVETATQKFGSIDALVNNASIFFTKPFTGYTAEDFKALSSTNVTQGVVKQMVAQKSGGSVRRRYHHGLACRQPHCGYSGGGSEDHRGRTCSHHVEPGRGVCRGENSLQCGCARGRGHATAQKQPEGLSENAFAMGTICDVKDIVEAVVYLTEARYVTGEVLHVDGSAHSGKW
jgi:NAD(P)-dependent dehydrogenase (short-subunit alcohol dehydrogenase family)